MCSHCHISTYKKSRRIYHIYRFGVTIYQRVINECVCYAVDSIMFIVKSSVCVAVERQDSLDSAEYHSQLEDDREEEEEVEEEEEEEEGEEMAMATTNKKGSKKKRYFGIFRKNKSKDNRKNKLTPTADLMQ